MWSKMWALLMGSGGPWGVEGVEGGGRLPGLVQHGITQV